MQKLTWALGILLITFFALIAWLCFFQFPYLDDCMTGYLVQKYGLWGSIVNYLEVSNGRFSSIPFYLLITSSRILMDQYYGLTLIILLGLSYIPYFSFVKIFSRLLFDIQLNNKQAVFIAAALMMTFIALVPDPSTFLFWIATVVTYTIPFGLFLWLLCAWAIFFRRDQQHHWKWATIISFLTFFFAGTNEILMFYAAGLPILIGCFLLISRKRIPPQIYMIAAIAIIAGLVVVVIPGAQARRSFNVVPQSVLTSAVGSVFRTIEYLQIILSNPLFYVSCFGILLLATHLKVGIKDYFATKRSHWVLEIGVLIAVMYVFDLILRQVGNIITPARAQNNLLSLTIIGFWWILIINVRSLAPVIDIFRINPMPLKKLFIGLLTVGLLFSGFAWQLLDNLVTLPIHKEIIQNRIDLIREAKAKGEKSVFIPLYPESVKAMIQQKFPNKVNFITEKFAFPPAFSFFLNGPDRQDNVYIYAEYYGIDTIIRVDGKFPRWELTNHRIK